MRLGLPLSRLHVPDIRSKVIRRGLVASISDTTIWRWFSEDAIKPWTHRSWIFPRDPQFRPKAARVLDLYAGCWEGRPLRDDEFVLSADEKTSIQARVRRHPTVAPNGRHPMLVEHEYERAERSSTSPRGTSGGPGCSGGARRTPVPSRSTGSSSGS